MNKTFKTLWNDVRRCYIVANEAQKSHGKPSKSAVVAVAVAAALGATAASAAYVEPGFVAQNSSQVEAAKQSWETNEYTANWGLTAQKASSAYALGYYGQGVKVGMMDSGILKDHVELSGDRWHAVHASGAYGQDGVYYPQNAPGSQQEYHKGQEFDVDGYYNSEYNDNHGTGCAGVYAGNRNGTGMHGVAWGSEFYSANTGGNDNTNYGPFPDYAFFKAGYDALVDAGVKIINNSFGTNLKQVDENGNILDYYHSGPELTTVNDIEYEYFLFKKMYEEGPSFVDAAWEAVEGKDVIQVFTNGNNDRANPYHRALYPYFNPEAEKQWIAIAGLRQNSSWSDPDNYRLEANFNEAGYAKYWTMAGPGQNGYTANISGGYGGYSGTSMAAPFVSGAFAVLASRYQDMSAVQVREVLLTTANHKNEDGTNMEGWDNVDGTTPLEGEVSDRMGWGVPDLEKGMYGPGQFFNGNFDYNMKTVKLDVWSNDISQVALDQRAKEDIAWLKSVTEDGTIDGKVVVSDNPEDYKLTNTSTGSANADGQDHNYDLAGIPDKEISLEDAMKWRLEYYEKRAQSIRDKIANGEYDGSLTKRGAGTLVMTGNNTYRGGTTVEEGTLLGFAESFGVTETETKVVANGKVTVNGGIFGVLNSYDDKFTMKGELTHKADADHSVDITVNKGGTYGIVAGQDVEVGSLSFADGAGITVVSVDGDVLKEAFESETGVTGSVTAEKLEGVTSTNPVVDPDYAFFDTAINVDAENGKIEATLSRNEESASVYAANGSQAAMANALMANTDSAVFADMVGATKGQVRNTLASLSNDFHLAAQNATIVNTALMGRMIKDQANAYGEAQRAELENGATLWAAGMGSWGDVDAGGASVNMDVDYYAGFIGAELPYGNGNKVGVFFGYGQTDFDAGNDGDMDSDDIHIGMYGENDWEKFGLTYGFAYTTQDREGKQSLNFLDQVTHNAIDYNATVFQIFGEASYKGFNTESYQVEPYIGLSWLNVSADDFTQRAGNHSVKTEIDDQNLGLANIGVRGALPFTAGSVAMKVRADVGYMQFFGDKEATAKVTVGDAGTASITGEELSGMGMVGIGLDAAIGKNATFGVNYTGAFGSDITSHGIGAKLGIKF